MGRLKVRPASVVFALVLLIYGLRFGSEIVSVAKNHNTCVCSYDGFGYYMYLPQLFGSGNLKMDRIENQALQDKYCDSTEVYQLYRLPDGKQVDIYHIGQAFLELPAYTAGHLISKATGDKQDGFSKPYHIAFILNAFLFVFLGALYSLKLFRLFFDESVSAILLVICFFATNYYITSTESYELQHHYLLAIIAAFAYHLLHARQSGNYRNRHFYYAVLLFGLCTVIRPTHALLGIFPLILIWKELPSKRHYFFSIFLFGVSAFIWNIPQLLYWKLVGGSWLLLNLHVEELILIDPHVSDFLFSFRKGWLLYTPVFLLLLPAFVLLRRKDKRLFLSLLVTLIVFIWVMSSWECWWYASSFGSRVMVDIYPLLLIPLGFLFEAKVRKLQIALYSFTGLCLIMNVFQSWQYAKGWLHEERMTTRQYFYIFGRTQLPDYGTHRLLIDRHDTSWVTKTIERNDPELQVRKTVLFNSNERLFAYPKTDLDITKFELLDKLETDETLIEVEMEYATSDPSKSSILRLETVSRFNAYNWQSAELSAGKEKNKPQTLRMKFNLPDLHHHNDKLQVFVDNEDDVTITISSFKITAYSLIRR